MPTEEGAVGLDDFGAAITVVAALSDDFFAFFARETGRTARRPFAAITGVLRFADLL
jgi:hypothetical protein